MDKAEEYERRGVEADKQADWVVVATAFVVMVGSLWGVYAVTWLLLH